MAADLHIHILQNGLTKEDITFFNGPHSGNDPRWKEIFHKLGDTPNIWIGEVSFLKAALFDAPDEFIPDSVGTIEELFEEQPDGMLLLTEESAANILAALDLENSTSYRLQENGNEVRAFLASHLGAYACTIAW